MSVVGGRGGLVFHLSVTVVAYLLALTYALSLGALVEMYGLIWPPAGVAVASLLLAPRRWWPALLATLFVTQVLYDVGLYDAALLPAVLWASANFVSYLIVPTLIVRWRGMALDTVGRVLRCTLALLIGSAPAGLLGALGAVISGDPTPYLITAALWATGAVIGILMVVPIALLVAGRIPVTERAPGEAAAILGAVLVVSVGVFALGDHLRAAALDYVVLLPVVWAALRLRLSGAAIAIVLTTNVALLGTALGRGPFAAAVWTPIESAALLRVFMVVMAVSALLIASRAQESASSTELAAHREQLLAAVSHELRAPLTPIVGFSQLLLRERRDLDPAAREWVASIERNGRHLTDLIDDLLLLSRAGRSRLTVEPERLALGELAAQVLGDHQRSDVVAAGIDHEVRASADPLHVRQILDNLLQNGLRHGQPPVRVAVGQVDGQARLAVTDHGEGVAEELVERLFDPFSQPELGDPRSSQGLGLGLAISSQLARSNGGIINYEHDPDLGVTFEVLLPLAED